MSNADQFQHYADALRGAVQSKTEKEQRTMIDLAQTSTQAAGSTRLTRNGSMSLLAA